MYLNYNMFIIPNNNSWDVECQGVVWQPIYWLMHCNMLCTHEGWACPLLEVNALLPYHRPLTLKIECLKNKFTKITPSQIIGLTYFTVDTFIGRVRIQQTNVPFHLQNYFFVNIDGFTEARKRFQDIIVGFYECSEVRFYPFTVESSLVSHACRKYI